MNDHPRFSIIVPARNGGSYLPTCVASILEQDYSDYELIVSDDHSIDGSVAYLQSVEHACFRWVVPPEGLSMTEHWEWALSLAKGDWLIFVGQDDTLQLHFFKLADKLISLAQAKEIKVIMSARALYFWPGCQSSYGDQAASLFAYNHIGVYSTKYEALKALLGVQHYFELPEMYTTSLFHRSVIEKAKVLQGGRLFNAHPQDANLAAIACCLEQKYLRCEIPLGWVGSSPKSAGMAITAVPQEQDQSRDEIIALKKDYLNKVSNSKLQYNPKAGDFLFANLSVYLWQAFLQTAPLHDRFWKRILRSRLFLHIMFSTVYSEFTNSSSKAQRTPLFEDILKANALSLRTLSYVAMITSPACFIWKMGIRIIRKLQRPSDVLSMQKSWSKHPETDLAIISREITAQIQKKGWLD